MQIVPTTACKYEELEDSEHKCTFWPSCYLDIFGWAHTGQEDGEHNCTFWPSSYLDIFGWAHTEEEDGEHECTVWPSCYLDIFGWAHTEQEDGEDLQGLEGEGVPGTRDVRVTNIPNPNIFFFLLSPNAVLKVLDCWGFCRLRPFVFTSKHEDQRNTKGKSHEISDTCKWFK